MGKYAVTFSVGGDLPPMQQASPYKVGGDDELFIQNNQWKIKVLADAQSQSEAITITKKTCRQKLILFQVLLAGSSTSFSLYPREDQGCIVEELSTNKRSVRSNSVVVTVAEVGATASLLVTSNVDPALAKLRELFPTLASQPDCQVVLYYYGKAMAETDILYKFLNHVTAIEAMLSEGSETTEKISRRLAVIVSSRFENTQKTFDDFKGYYDTRSRILHGDKIPNLTNQTVAAVSELSRTAVRNYLLLRRQYSERDVKRKLDKFFDPTELQSIKTDTAF